MLCSELINALSRMKKEQAVTARSSRLIVFVIESLDQVNFNVGPEQLQ